MSNHTKTRIFFQLILLFCISFIVFPVIAGDKFSNTKFKLTVPIIKDIPDSVLLVHAPDTDKIHYRVLDDTHFSYRCYSPYVHASKKAAVEVCQINPVKLEIISWPETEVINLVSGSVSITEVDDTEKHYLAGDIFVLPQGFKGVWNQSEKLLKVVVRHPLHWKD